MQVLHAHWQPAAGPDGTGHLLFWAEAAERPAAAAGWHPAAAAPEAVRELLGHVGSSGRGVAEARLWLPSARSGPLPSQPLARPRRGRPPRLALAPWTVRGPALAPADAILALTALGDGDRSRRARQKAELGDDLRYWQTAARLALAALARERIAPGLEHEPARGVYAARWRLVASDGDIAPRLAALRACMPELCRAGAEDPACPATPAALLEDFLNAAVDALARRWGTAPPPRPGSGPARRWLAALFADEARVTGSPAQLRHLHEAHRNWLRGLAPEGDGRARVAFRLEEPADARGGWRLHLLLQARDDPSLLVGAEEVWRDRLGPLAQRFGEAQELLLTGLGHAARIFEPLRLALRQADPTVLELGSEQAFAFLREVAPLLEESGFGVLVPLWWTRPSARLGVRLRVSSQAAGGVASGMMGLHQLVRYRWEVSLGGASIAPEEFEALVARKAPLVQLRGAWVRLDPEQVEAAARFFERREHERDVPLAEAMRLGLGDRGEIDDLPIEEVAFEGEVGAWLERLKRGEAPELLPPPATLAGTLRRYQQQGLSWLAFLTGLGLGACLADDMGLGKTIQTLAFLLHEREAGRLEGPVLLISPTSVVRNWHEELQRFAPGLRALEHQGSGRLQGEAFRARLAETDLVLTSYATVRRDADLLGSVDWYAVVLDEAQNIKNPGAFQTRSIRRLSAGVRIALTGTPVENRLDELWSIMDFLNPGYLGSRRAFRTRLALPIERDGDQDALETLRRLTAPMILRRVKTDRDVIRDLPDKIEGRVYGHLSEEQASLYESVVRDAMGGIEESEGIERKGLVLAMLTGLKQICNHPAQYLREADPGPAAERRSPKLARLVALLEETLEAGDSSLVFTQYRQMGELLVRHLSGRLDAEVPFLHGGVRADKRAELVRRFQQGEGPAVFVLSLKAGGTGLNLTRATHVFHYDRWWNPAVEDQASDRAYRIGQRRNVQVHRFVTLGTLEERIDEMIAAKQTLARSVVGAGESWLAALEPAALREVVALRRETLA